MNRIDALIHNYSRFVSLPWERGLPGAQRVWFAVYEKHDERRLRAKIGEFELATKQASHAWHSIDLKDAFARWLAASHYRDSYFEEPEYLDEMALKDFHEYVSNMIKEVLQSSQVDETSVVAILGVGGLYGFTKVSAVIEDLEASIRGRLLVFFPGEYEKNNYRLLDARDGWNYMAVPITAETNKGVSE